VNEAYNSFFIPRNKIVLSTLRNPTIYALVSGMPPSIINLLRGNKIFFKGTGKPIMSEKERVFLTGIYEKDVRDIESLLGRSLPWLGRNLRT
jgi:hypothetical protein